MQRGLRAFPPVRRESDGFRSVDDFRDDLPKGARCGPPRAVVLGGGRTTARLAQHGAATRHQRVPALFLFGLQVVARHRQLSNSAIQPFDGVAPWEVPVLPVAVDKGIDRSVATHLDHTSDKHVVRSV